LWILLELLQELVHADAPPGSEGEVREIVLRELEPVVDQISVDVLGNVIAWKNGQGDEKLMLCAHQDEDWAQIVTHIEEEGFLRFARLVGHRWSLLGQRVVIHASKGKRTGVIGLKAPHLIPLEKQLRGYKPRDDLMFIDCGAVSRADALDLGIEVGQYVTAFKHFEEIRDGRLLGSCFDNRVGVAVLIETMRRIESLKPAKTLVVVASVQEELGTRGAQTAAFQVNPDYAIALDIAPTGDHPGVNPQKIPAELGGGPVLLRADQSGATSVSFTNWLEGIAVEYNIAHQSLALRAPIHFGTDASAIELVRGGSHVTAVLAPTRYFHTSNSIVDLSDIEGMVGLLVGSVESLGKLHCTS
jgi:endoglucanase